MATISAIVSDLAALVSLFNSGSLDTVGFFDQQSFQQIFAEARPERMGVRETAKTMLHPLENGQMIADFKIINPQELEVSVLVNSQYYSSMYSQMKNYFINSTLLALSSRVAVVNNLIITQMPREETAEMFDTVRFFLRLQEVLIAQSPPSYDPVAPTPATPDDANFTTQVPQGQIAPGATTSLSSSQDFGFV